MAESGVVAMYRRRQLTRKQTLAAEIHGYSYDNYENHLGIGNIRFEKLMPDDVDILERAEREGWDSSRLAKALDIPEENVASFRRLYRKAKEIADAPTPAEAFRRGVRHSIQYAVEEGLGDVGSIERLVTQICYRAADFGFCLDTQGQRVLDYSWDLRQENEYDREYRQAEIRRQMQGRPGQDEEKESG